MGQNANQWFDDIRVKFFQELSGGRAKEAAQALKEFGDKTEWFGDNASQDKLLEAEDFMFESMYLLEIHPDMNLYKQMAQELHEHTGTPEQECHHRVMMLSYPSVKARIQYAMDEAIEEKMQQIKEYMMTEENMKAANANLGVQATFGKST